MNAEDIVGILTDEVIKLINSYVEKYSKAFEILRSSLEYRFMDEALTIHFTGYSYDNLYLTLKNEDEYYLLKEVLSGEK